MLFLVNFNTDTLYSLENIKQENVYIVQMYELGLGYLTMTNQSNWNNRERAEEYIEYKLIAGDKSWVKVDGAWTTSDNRKRIIINEWQLKRVK
jgi:hypothetical protein